MRHSNVRNGQRVYIVQSPDKYYKYNLKGRLATVIDSHYSDIAVRVDNIINKSSSRGLFYLEAPCLAEYEGPDKAPTNNNDKGEKTMIGNYDVRKVKFLENKDGTECSNSDKTYEYACFDKDIETYDYVLVRTAHHGYAVAQVVGEPRKKTPNDDKTLTREIVCTVDLLPYSTRVENRKQMRELEKAMNERAAQLDELQKYEFYAAHDATFAELLKTYKELGAE